VRNSPLTISVLMHKKFAEIAIKGEQYMQPIVLIQSENENRGITVNIIKIPIRK
jgi:hypothetical protein